MCHSTESALLGMHNDVQCVLDDGSCVMLLLLDLSAAFDPVGHGILLSRLSQCIGDQGSAYAWFESYLSNRSQFVQIKDTSSSDRQLTFGLPKGSFVGPNPILGLYVSCRSYPASPGCRVSHARGRHSTVP